jgi:hypothetical protein
MSHWVEGCKRSCIALCVVAVVLTVGCEGGSSGGESSNSGTFSVSYVSAAGYGDEESVGQLFRQSGLVDLIVQGLNEVFALPSDINVIMTPYTSDVATDGPYWHEAKESIVFPYSFFIVMLETLQQANPTMSEEDLLTVAIKASVFIIYHETAHALIDVLSLPVLGLEETAADGLAAAVLTLQADTADFVVAAAVLFGSFADVYGSGGHSASAYADNHMLDVQRYYNLMCFVYGADPASYSGLVPAYLPESRANSCYAEAQQNLNSWLTLLEPYTK